MSVWTKIKNVGLYLWLVKSLFLVPWDIYTDVKLAITHFGNGHVLWGSLTTACLLPSLMFPYHYYQLLKFAVYKFRILFLDHDLKKETDEIDKKNTFYNGIIAYFEDIPQFILQVYILWKTPPDCFSWREIDAWQSIGTSFLSISSTVVPFYEKEKDAKWSLLSCEGFFGNFLIGTFFNVIPKLVLISWIFSVLNWYGWFFIIPILLVCACMTFCWKCKADGEDDENEKTTDSSLNIPAYVLFRSLQLTFGYAGWIANMVVCILLLLFVIPLGLNLAAAINSSNEIDSDPFDIFPVDPFPSSTICFTNFTILAQEERWENKTTTFSNSCNKTFEAVPCEDVRETIITKLSIMIGIMSAGHIATVCCGLVSVVLLGSLIGALSCLCEFCCCCCDDDDD